VGVGDGDDVIGDAPASGMLTPDPHPNRKSSGASKTAATTKVRSFFIYFFPGVRGANCWTTLLASVEVEAA
jgi:hypothetical protein